jgi:antitoxin component YwqK of YwqJK toxin-antitoxin module/peroxiredoxin
MPRQTAHVALTFLAVCALLTACDRIVREEWSPGLPKRTGTLVAGKQEGPWSYWYSNGQKQADGSWTHDYQDGHWTWWYSSGQIQQTGDYSGKNLSRLRWSSAPRSGHWQHFYENGQLYCEGDYAEDRQTGQWTYFTADGRPFATGSFAAGVKDGEWTWWHEAGKAKQRGAFAKGVKIGVWTTWAADGAVVRREEYTKQGAPVVALEAPAPAKPTAEAPSTAATPAPPAGPATPAATAAQPAVEVKPAEEAILLPAAGTPSLSPIQVAPRLWTPDQEGDAASLIAHYTTGGAVTGVDGDYSDKRFGNGGERQRTQLLGKVLPQTRFLSSGGDVLDLKDRVGKHPVLMVVLRGFSGQVCLYCATQTAALANQIAKFRDLGVEVVLVYPGPVESVPVFIRAVESLRKDPPPMPLALDVSLLLVRGLGIEDNLALPASILIDKEGLVRYAYVGQTIADRPSVNDLLQAAGRFVK